MKDPVAKAAYDKARRARLHVDRRPTVCKVCGAKIVQARTSVRLYCTNACKSRQFYGTHPGYDWTPVPVEPMPMPYVGDDIFVQARAAAGISGDYSVDWGQNDILGEAVLAILEGRDPREAVRSHRAGEKARQRLQVPGVDDLGSDGRRLLVVWEHDAFAA